MWKNIHKVLFGVKVDENFISFEAKAIRALFEALKQEGFSEEQALRLVAAKVNRGF